MRVSIILTAIIFFNLSSASRILFLFPTPSKSHLIIVHALSTLLADKGHDVTVFSPFPLDKPIENHREFKTPINDKLKALMEGYASGSISMIKMLVLFPHIGIELAEDMVHTSDFQRILNEEFDLIVIGLTMNNFLLGFGDHFKCPTAMLSVQKHSTYSNYLVGNPYEMNAVQHAFFPSGSLLSYPQRIKNFIASIGDALMFSGINYYDKTAYEKIFSQPRYRSHEESMRNVSLVLVNDHFSEGAVRPNVPAVVEIRGIQVNPTPKALPKDIQKFLDDATDGAILFSLGTNVKSEFVSDDLQKILMSVFGKLKQRIIMKWDAPSIKNQPDNVMLEKWLPQDDILAHKNMKLFIAHCGLGGVVESKYHGVPILGLPMFGDQRVNCNDIEGEGWALQLDMKTMTENEFSGTIDQLLHNDSYSAVVKKYSLLYRDRPMSPRETAVYWIEYVIRHHGAPHIQYLAVHQNFWQRSSLDVIAFLAVCIVILLKLFKFIFKRIVRKLFGKKTSVVGDKKRK